MQLLQERAIRARNSVWAIFFATGICSMAWVPRIPEIKRSLGVNNGQFGLILLGSTAGAIIGAQVCGRAVHAFGSKRIVNFAGVLMPLGLILMALSTHNVPAMFVSLFVMGCGYVSIDVAVNTQAVAIEKHLKHRYMSTFHGLWSTGAFLATIFGGVISHYISPESNLIVVGFTSLVFFMTAASYLLNPSEDLHKGDEDAKSKIPLFEKRYLVLWLIGFGLIGALLPEGATSDWSAILLKENMGISKGLNASAFACFALAMIFSRMTGDKVLQALGPVRTVKLGGYIGGIGMGAGIAIAVPLSHSHPLAALLIIDFGFILAGLGIGPMVPALMLAAAALPGIAPSVALARIGIIGLAAYFIGPTVTGGLAQLTNLPIAMAFPVVSLLFAGWISRVMK